MGHGTPDQRHDLAVNLGYDDIDPRVFIEDDGHAWLCWGNHECYYAKLKVNMIEFDGPIGVLPDERVKGYEEAS